MTCLLLKKVRYLLQCQNSKIAVILPSTADQKCWFQPVTYFLSKRCRNAIDSISIYFHFDSKTAEAFFKFATLFSEGCIIAIDLSVFIFISISRQLQYS